MQNQTQSDDERMLIQYPNGYIAVAKVALADAMARKGKGHKIFLLAPDDVVDIDDFKTTEEESHE